MKEDLSYLGCKWHPQAYDADVCEDCIHDSECYARFMCSMEYFREDLPVNDAFGVMKKIKYPGE